MYRFAVAGVHSGGKSTAVKHIVGKLKDFKVVAREVPEAATDCVMHGYDLVHGKAFEVQLAIMARQIWNEQNVARLSPKVQIIDRPMFDILAYAEVLYYDNRLTQYEYEYLRQSTLGYCQLQPYDFVAMFAPLNEAVVNDGVRKNFSIKYQQRVWDSMKHVAENYIADDVIYYVKTSNREQRWAEVYDEIIRRFPNILKVKL